MSGPVLVAGGAGLLGSAVCLDLARQGWRVEAVDLLAEWGDGRAARLARLKSLAAAGVGFSRVDLTDAGAVRALLRNDPPDAVVNAALFPPDGPGLSPLLSSCVDGRVPYFLHLSDAALYREAREPGEPAGEDEPLDPGDDPALVKRAREEEALHSSGLASSTLRVFPLLGPGFPKGRFPVDALEAILSGEEVVLLADEPVDFLHVEDAARGIRLALSRRPRGRALNLGSGLGVRPSEVLAALAVRAGRPVRLRVEGPPGRRPRVADTVRAWNEIGFCAQRGIGDAVEAIAAARLGGRPLLGFPEAEAPRPSGGPARPAAAGPPREVSRRDLFGIFRRPFGPGGPPRPQ